jgi:LysM repeat protein
MLSRRRLPRPRILSASSVLKNDFLRTTDVSADLDPVTLQPVPDTEVPFLPSPCDLCFVKALKFRAESPYYYDPLLSSVYTSKTSSCGILGMPLTQITIPGITTTSVIPTPTPICTGSSYTIKPGDTCESIAKSQHIGTGWLITDNDLTIDCDIPASGSLCLVNTCKTVTLQKGDTCDTVAQANKISVAQLKAWNLVSVRAPTAILANRMR